MRFALVFCGPVRARGRSLGGVRSRGPAAAGREGPPTAVGGLPLMHPPRTWGERVFRYRNSRPRRRPAAVTAWPRRRGDDGPSSISMARPSSAIVGHRARPSSSAHGVTWPRAPRPSAAGHRHRARRGGRQARGRRASRAAAAIGRRGPARSCPGLARPRARRPKFSQYQLSTMPRRPDVKPKKFFRLMHLTRCCR